MHGLSIISIRLLWHDEWVITHMKVLLENLHLLLQFTKNVAYYKLYWEWANNASCHFFWKQHNNSYISKNSTECLNAMWQGEKSCHFSFVYVKVSVEFHIFHLLFSISNFFPIVYIFCGRSFSPWCGSKSFFPLFRNIFCTYLCFSFGNAVSDITFSWFEQQMVLLHWL